MKGQKNNLTYFEIFPNAKLEITASDGKKTPISTNPKTVQTIIKSLFQMTIPPTFIQLEHTLLLEHANVLVFDGLDVKRYNQYKDQLSAFSALSVPKFPIFVEATEREGFVVGGWKSLLGIKPPKNILKKYNNFEEMILNDQQLIDNCYPFNKEGFEIPPVVQFSNYQMKALTAEELKEFHELPDANPNEKKEKIIAIDAEMIETSVGVELARVSATDIKGKTILNQLFKPVGTIVDLRTPFSGITEDMLVDVDVPSTDGVRILSQIADKNTIIIGHSLENDLRALKLIHYRCIDTAILYKENKRKPALALIYQKHIGKPFRTDADKGHDSAEDARAAAELAQFAIKENVVQTPEPPKVPEFIKELLDKHGPVNIVDRKSRVNYDGVDSRLSLRLTENDSESLEEFLKTMNDFDINFVHFDGMNGISLNPESEKKAVNSFNTILQTIIDKSPPRTALIVYAPNGNFQRIKSEKDKTPPGHDPLRRDEFISIRQGMLWIHCTETNIE